MNHRSEYFDGFCYFSILFFTVPARLPVQLTDHPITFEEFNDHSIVLLGKFL